MEKTPEDPCDGMAMTFISRSIEARTPASREQKGLTVLGVVLSISR